MPHFHTNGRPAVRRLGDFDLNAAPSTQCFTISGMPTSPSPDWLRAASRWFCKTWRPNSACNPSAADYLVKFRNPALTYLSAERLFILYSNGGLDAVRKELGKLRRIAVI